MRKVFYYTSIFLLSIVFLFAMLFMIVYSNYTYSNERLILASKCLKSSIKHNHSALFSVEELKHFFQVERNF